MKREKSFPTVLFVLLVLACVAGVGAQETDCSKCETKTGKFNVTKVDQTVCPGANAVVCLKRFNKQYKAECKPNGIELRDCKPTSKKHNYPAKAFPANHCGTATYDQNGRRISSSCGNPGNTNTTHKSDYHYCSGKPWDPTVAVEVDIAYTLQIATPYGPTMLSEGENQLDSTIVSIPSELLSAAREQGLLDDDGQLISLRLEIELSSESGVSVPDQNVSALVVTGNPVVSSAVVERGTVVLELGIPSANVGAFAEYALDLGGLRVDRDSAAQTSSTPEEGGLDAEPIDLFKMAEVPSKSVARDLVKASLTLSSGGQLLLASNESIGSLP